MSPPSPGRFCHRRLDPVLFAEILAAYDSWLTRAYLVTRGVIIRDLLADLESNLPPQGLVVNLGSGIGLFDIYCARLRPDLRFLGIDADLERIELSRKAADRLGLANVEFRHGDVSEALPDLRPTAVITFDLLHHLPPAAQRRVFSWVADHLDPEGLFLIKDISVSKPWKVRFTKLLDDLMTRGEPTYYFGTHELKSNLARLGFATSSFHVKDQIPFPHIIYVAHPRQRN